MKCSICKNEYPDIHKIQHGEKTLYMCSKSWNDILYNLDPTIDSVILTDSCPDERVNDAS
jgi:hypothetical protein